MSRPAQALDAGHPSPSVDPQRERTGLIFAALCAMNAAFVPAVAKLTTNAADPAFVATVTTLFGAACAGTVLLVRGEWRVLIGRRTGPRLLLVGTLGTAVAFLLFYSGAQRATAIETVLCLQIEPAYSLLLAWLVLGHRPTRRRVAAIGVLLAGIALAVGARRTAPSAGLLLLLATPLCWQLSHLVVLRGLPGVTPSVLTGARYIYGGLILTAYCLLAVAPAALPEPAALRRALPLLAVQGAVLSYVGTMFWYSAITRLDLARTTAIVVPSIPLLSLGASFALLGEVPSVWQGLGMLLTAAGVVAFVTAPHARAGWRDETY